MAAAAYEGADAGKWITWTELQQPVISNIQLLTASAAAQAALQPLRQACGPEPRNRACGRTGGELGWGPSDGTESPYPARRLASCMLAPGRPRGYPAASTIPVAALTETAPAVLVPVMCRCRSCTTCTQVAVLTTANEMPVEEYEDCFKLRDHFQQAPSGLSLCWCGACCASCTGSWPTRHGLVSTDEILLYLAMLWCLVHQHISW